MVGPHTICLCQLHPFIDRLIRAFPSNDPRQYQNPSNSQTIAPGKMAVFPSYRIHVVPPSFIASSPPKTAFVQKRCGIIPYTAPASHHWHRRLHHRPCRLPPHLRIIRRVICHVTAKSASVPHYMTKITSCWRHPTEARQNPLKSIFC